MRKMTPLLIVLSLILLNSCSTMGFLPTDGGGAKFNLATVEYVKKQTAEQQAALMAQMADDVQLMLDSLLAEDRAALDSLDASLEILAAKIDSAEANTTKQLAGMSKELTTVKTNASSTRMVIRRINDNIDALPVTTLETFNKAIDEYLKKSEESEE